MDEILHLSLEPDDSPVNINKQTNVFAGVQRGAVYEFREQTYMFTIKKQKNPPYPDLKKPGRQSAKVVPDMDRPSQKPAAPADMLGPRWASEAVGSVGLLLFLFPEIREVSSGLHRPQ